jgi:coenzyme F420-0:L-glutamate ligase / coenzyme F420-1:gamma-L-glutamate ligase
MQSSCHGKLAIVSRIQRGMTPCGGSAIMPFVLGILVQAGPDRSAMTAETKLGSVIGQRRSVRRYRPGPVDRRTVERILLAATRAPSAHNRQPWRFAVIEDRFDKEKLATAMGQKLHHDRAADGDDPQAIEADAARSHARITEAPAVIVVCLDMSQMDRYPDERCRNAEYLMAVQSTAMAAQNLLLAAEQEGLGACVMCAPLFCPDVVVHALSLPQTWQPQMLITLGSPVDRGKERVRLPLETIVTWPRG